jgi:hypothetical protein
VIGKTARHAFSGLIRIPVETRAAGTDGGVPAAFIGARESIGFRITTRGAGQRAEVLMSLPRRWTYRN